MPSLPVFATIAASYRFLLRDFLTVVRLAWFPLLVVAVVQYFAAQASLDALAAAGPNGADRIIGSPYDLVQWVVEVVVFAIVAVAIHRVILFGETRPGQYITFAFGRSEILFMILQVLAVVVFSVLGLASVLALGPRGMGAGDIPSVTSLLSLIVIIVAIVFVFVRLAPIYPIAVADNRLDFRQAWELTSGRFWRMFLVFALGMLPLGVVVAAAEGVFLAMVEKSVAGKPVSTELAVGIARGLVVYQVAFIYVIAVIASGLGVALLCYSYKALRGLRPSDLLTPEYQVRP
jgi:hypothetical protein